MLRPLALLSCRKIGRNRIHGEVDILEHRHPREQRIILKDNAPFRARTLNRSALEKNLTLIRFDKTSDQRDERGFPSTGAPDDADKFPFIDVRLISRSTGSITRSGFSVEIETLADAANFKQKPWLFLKRS